jgi:hypothetical protein
MNGFWILVHVLGYTFWIGGGVATMVAGIVAKTFAPESRLGAYKVTSAVQRILVGPGAVAVTISGFLLTMPYMKSGAVPGWMMLMMVAGFIGAMVTLGVTVPVAARIGSLSVDPRGDLPERFAGLRARLVWSASVSGGMALLALVAGSLLRF